MNYRKKNAAKAYDHMRLRGCRGFVEKNLLKKAKIKSTDFNEEWEWIYQMGMAHAYTNVAIMLGTEKMEFRALAGYDNVARGYAEWWERNKKNKEKATNGEENHQSGTL